MMNKLPMTVEGFNRLQDELKRLKSTERPAIIRAIAEARTHGDIAENAEKFVRRDFIGCRWSWVEIARGKHRCDDAVAPGEEAAAFVRSVAAGFSEHGIRD